MTQISENVEKYYAITINGTTAYLKTFEMSDKPTTKIGLIETIELYKEEFHEYIEDTDAWINLENFIKQLGDSFEWSTIGRARVEQKIRKSIGIKETDPIWVYDFADWHWSYSRNT